jgi:hypothetical protein
LSPVYESIQHNRNTPAIYNQLINAESNMLCTQQDLENGRYQEDGFLNCRLVLSPLKSQNPVISVSLLGGNRNVLYRPKDTVLQPDKFQWVPQPK